MDRNERALIHFRKRSPVFNNPRRVVSRAPMTFDNGFSNIQVETLSNPSSMERLTMQQRIMARRDLRANISTGYNMKGYQ